jgi:hypothetical protein
MKEPWESRTFNPPCSHDVYGLIHDVGRCNSCYLLQDLVAPADVLSADRRRVISDPAADNSLSV